MFYWRLLRKSFIINKRKCALISVFPINIKNDFVPGAVFLVSWFKFLTHGNIMCSLGQGYKLWQNRFFANSCQFPTSINVFPCVSKRQWTIFTWFPVFETHIFANNLRLTGITIHLTWSWIINSCKCQSCYHIETSQLIYRANQ